MSKNTFQAADLRLKEMWAHLNCLIIHNYFKVDSIKNWYINELVRYQNMLIEGNPDAVSLINGFYEGTDMYALRNAYKSIGSTGCLEDQMGKMPMSSGTKIAIAVAIGLGAAFFLLRK